MVKKSARIKIAIICGGPSLERGISLNSARSVMDHLQSEQIEIVPVYFDVKKNPYSITTDQLYSNTPSDFDFKLQQTASALSEESLVELLRSTDLVFPIMHGTFGEDGTIQSFLEKYNLPFVGSPAAACKKAFDKFNANQYINRQGFFTLSSVVLKIYQTDHRRILQKFFKQHQITRAIVKPASGGSSIGVFSVSTVSEALEKVQLLFSKRMDTRVVVEPFAEGAEFTIVILENRFGLPVALPPTEIETDYTEHQIFNYRRKYLPTRQVTWHCPPRFNKQTIEKIQAQAEQLFALFGMHDFGRFDGWVLPDDNVWFCDFNPVSGMEQNSFLFQQASRVGMTHGDVLRHIAEVACARYETQFPEKSLATTQHRKTVQIIMGGDNSEKQVSLMSGTNVWLKLRNSKKYMPQPYLLDTRGTVWQLPYQLCLNHTVEEIAENCEQYLSAKAKLGEFEERARLHLGLQAVKDPTEFFEPKQLTLNKFIDSSQFVFIALHGGDGENGTLQKMLTARGVKFNGPGERVSRLCMDKWQTSRCINELAITGVAAIPSTVVTVRELRALTTAQFRRFWSKTKKTLSASTLIIKPRADGCTTGVAHLFTANDLEKYIEQIVKKAAFIPKLTFTGQQDVIELPSIQPTELLLERFIETDTLRVTANTLKHQQQTGWVEITIGVVEVGNKIKALNPSITVVEGEVLTVEEKFQGGTGVNITPPPSQIMKPHVREKVKKSIEILAAQLGIQGYSRIDAFVELGSGELLIIEVNTLPGLTPSTVFYHQGLAETPPIFPTALLELMIENKGY